MKRFLTGLGAFLACLAIGFQWYIIQVKWDINLGLSIVRFFSFFTIVTNLLLALFYLQRLFPRLSFLNYFQRKGATTQMAVYISFVALGYYILLRGVWDPQGLQWWTDKLLHLVNPLGLIVFWILYEKKEELNWKMIPGWFGIPAIYFAYVMLIGAFSVKYPYPFMNVDELGYPKVLLIGIGLLLALSVIAAFYIILGKGIAKQRNGIERNA